MQNTDSKTESRWSMRAAIAVAFAGGVIAVVANAYRQPGPANVAPGAAGASSGAPVVQTDWDMLVAEVNAVDTERTRDEMDAIQAQWIQCFVEGMEADNAGFHLLAPDAITAVDGRYFPDLDDFTWSRDWAFWEADGQPGIEYFAPGDFRNAPIDGSANTAAVSLSRAFGNGTATYAAVAQNGGLSRIDATFDREAIEMLRNLYDYVDLDYTATDPTAFSDWFGRSIGAGEMRTPMKVTVVSQNVAHEIVDLSAFLEAGGTGPVTFTVATGLSADEAAVMLESLQRP